MYTLVSTQLVLIMCSTDQPFHRNIHLVAGSAGQFLYVSPASREAGMLCCMHVSVLSIVQIFCIASGECLVLLFFAVARHLSSCPSDKDVLCSVYESVKDGQVHMHCALWRVPEEDDQPLHKIASLKERHRNYRW